MRSEHQKRVDEFHRLAGHIDPTEPTVPSPETRRLRARLILEEALETIGALGCIVFWRDQETDDTGIISGPVDSSPYELGISENCIQDGNSLSLEEIADGCWDTIVVTTGTLSACGIDDQEGQEEVDNNNLAKFGPGGYRRDDGKWVKPPNHPKPDIKGVLERQRDKEVQRTL